jgi:hypothetical protein
MNVSGNLLNRNALSRGQTYREIVAAAEIEEANEMGKSGKPSLRPDDKAMADAIKQTEPDTLPPYDDNLPASENNLPAGENDIPRYEDNLPPREDNLPPRE